MIETGNLIIRKHKAEDWQDLYAYLSLPEIYEFEPGQAITEEEARNMIKERAGGNDFYAVVLKEEGAGSRRMIGHLYFHQTEPKEFLTWELGFIFNPEFQNRGFCTEASRALIDYAFVELKAHRIQAFCDPRNPASWKVLEKIGMEREGFFKEKAFFKRDENGAPLWHDCYAYGILNAKIIRTIRQ